MSPEERHQQLISNLEKFKSGELDVLKTESGVSYIIHEIGDRPKLTYGQIVKTHYMGCLMNGNRFESSIHRNKPFLFHLGVGQVIKGWDDTVSLFKLGTRATIFVPSDLAYGDRDVGGGLIPPNSDIAFYIEVLGAE